MLARSGTSPQAAPAGGPRHHASSSSQHLDGLQWGCHCPRWTSSSRRSSQMMPDPLGNGSQPLGLWAQEASVGRGLWLFSNCLP